VDKYRLLNLMMQEQEDAPDTDLYCVSALLAKHLETVSGKLSEEEMQKFIEVGAAICRYANREFGMNVPVEDLFPPSEIWRDVH
jgi:hypothetical protein